jgi:aminoglycoside phosphotransferase (APT) family kinase protein
MSDSNGNPEVELERLREQLDAYVGRVVPGYDNAEITDFHEISAGWESDVYAFDLVRDDDREPLVLRAYPGQNAGVEAAHEFDAVRRLHEVGYAVPAVVWLEKERTPLGRPFILMERIDGHGMWGETFHGPKRRQRARFELFCKLFVQLHALDWRLFPDDIPVAFEDNPYAFVDRYIGLLGTYAERFGQPGYLPILDWLRSQRDGMACERPAPIHWDYHPENILIRADGSAFVIDWTQFEISDPRFDLAWTMILVGSQEGNRVRKRILETYEAMGGQAVRNIEPFEVFACGKRLASVTISLSAGAEALGMRAGAEEMMRRQAPALSRVYDRLQALTGLQVPEVEQAFERWRV